MKIRLHERHQKNTISLVIEYYLGFIKENGKTKHHRKFETLPFKLHKNPKSQVAKKENKKKRELARRIIAKRELEIAENKEGFFSNKGEAIYLLSYFEKLLEERKESKGNYGNWYSALNHLRNYVRSNITLAEVDIEFVKGFREYLLHKPITKSHKPLSRNSAVSYFNKFRACMNQAFNERLILVNPVIGVKGIKGEEPQREFLTLEELKAVSKEKCRFPVLKQAFLFSCYTGMRWSDIQNLTWNHIDQVDDENYRITFRQQKTKGQEYLDIPSHVIENYTNGIRKKEERVFVGLKYSAWHNIEITKWMMRAGITKDITFHCARHTFATLQLNLGTDIYTVSKLLGHCELKTTQIYAKIMNQKKRDAMNKIPDIMD